MLEMEKFTEPKPMMFSPKLDTRPKKKWNAADSEQFDDVFNQIQEDLDAGLIDKSSLTTAQRKQLEEAAKIKATRQMSKIFEGTDFVSREYLSLVEQTGTRYNYEKDDVYYPDKLKTPAYSTDAEAELAKEIFNSSFFSLLQKESGYGNTIPHNLNFFSSSSNPFKEADEENFAEFYDDPAYQALNEQSMSPRAVLQQLDPNFWNMINLTLDDIRQRPIANSDDEIAALDNPYLNKDLNMNFLDAPDPYTDNAIETFDILANFHTILMSRTWREWDDDEIFAFVSRAWEARTRLASVLRELFGKAVDQPFDLSQIDEENADDATSTAASTDPSLAEELTEEELEKAAQLEAQKNEVIGKLNNWWDSIGQHLNEGEVLPFGMLSALTPLMSTMMDWGDWGVESNEGITTEDENKYGFREKVISGYLNHIYNEYIFTSFKGPGVVTLNDITVDNPEYAKTIWDLLVQNKLITGNGEVTDKFDAKDPDFDLGLGLDKGIEDHIRNALREATIGEFSLEMQDTALVNGRNRTAIELGCTDGEMRTLPGIIDLLNTGETPLDQINNAFTAYQTIQQIFKSMTGLGIDKAETNGTVQYTKVNDKFEVVIYPEGQWQEWTGSGWQDVTDQAVTLTFNNESEMNAFKDKIQMVLSLLEPIIGTFSPENKEDGAPLEIMVDNSGSSSSVNMITSSDPNYKMGFDILYNPEYFQTQEWKDASSFLMGKVTESIGDKMFEKMQINRLWRMRHTRRKEDWEERKTEHEEEEYQRLKSEYKNMGLRKRATKKLEKIHSQRRKSDQKQLKNTEAKRVAKRIIEDKVKAQKRSDHMKSSKNSSSDRNSKKNKKENNKKK